MYFVDYYLKIKRHKITTKNKKRSCVTRRKVYVGSTTKPFLCQRLTAHRRDYNKYCNGGGNYVTSFEIIDGGNYGIYLLEACPCQSKDELRQRERHFVESMECVKRMCPGAPTDP